MYSRAHVLFTSAHYLRHVFFLNSFIYQCERAFKKTVYVFDLVDNAFVELSGYRFGMVETLQWAWVRANTRNIHKPTSIGYDFDLPLGAWPIRESGLSELESRDPVDRPPLPPTPGVAVRGRGFT